MFEHWDDLLKGYGIDNESDHLMQLLYLTLAVDEEWEGRHVVILVDEIVHPQILNNLASCHSESVPINVTLIAVVNPLFSTGLCPTSWPETFLHIDFKTPYRSTTAIASLARHIAKCQGQVVPDGAFGTDIKGLKPIVFDVGSDEIKFGAALQKSQELMGSDVTLLYDDFRGLPSSIWDSIRSQGKERGGRGEGKK